MAIHLLTLFTSEDSIGLDGFHAVMSGKQTIQPKLRSYVQGGQTLQRQDCLTDRQDIPRILPDIVQVLQRTRPDPSGKTPTSRFHGRRSRRPPQGHTQRADNSVHPSTGSPSIRVQSQSIRAPKWKSERPRHKSQPKQRADECTGLVAG
jgi:hypothetical protein